MIGLTLLTKTPKLNFPLIFLYRMNPHSAVPANGLGPRSSMAYGSKSSHHFFFFLDCGILRVPGSPYDQHPWP